MRLAVLFFSLSVFLFACASAPVETASATHSAEAASEDIALQSLDAALRAGVDYLSDKLPSNAKVAVVLAQSPTENLSNYIIDTAVMHLVNKDKFTVIERSEIGALQEEQMYQASGEVSDETAVSIGHQLGVQVIITSAIMETGDKYTLRVKALDVETARILGTRIYPVKSDPTLTALLKPSAQPAQAPVKAEAPKEPSKQTVINGDINIINNNTTTINGDVYVNKPDWF